MPVMVDPAALADYAAYPAEPDRDWLGRVCHLGAADLEQARRRTEDRSRFGYALQLVTVRAIGTFLPDPTAVPTPVRAAVARSARHHRPRGAARISGAGGALAAHGRDSRPARVSRFHRPTRALPVHRVGCIGRPGPTR